MNEQQARELALEALVRSRGECRFYRSDDLTQPDGGGPCRMEPNAESGVIAPCVLCGEPCPDPHIHLFERDPDAPDVATLEAALLSMDALLPVPWHTPTTVRALAEGMVRMRERAELAPLGLCSEGCAIRYQQGEPTTAERAESAEHPYTHAFFGLIGTPDLPVSPDDQPEPPRSKDPA